jgi:hypothetical protein
MSPDRQQEVLKWIVRVCSVAAVGMAGFAAWKLQPAMEVPALASAPVPQFAAATHISAESWNVFAPPAGAVASTNAADSAPHRFRLAGTFFAMGTGTNDARKAILDDTQTKQQVIVGQGEEAGGWMVHEVGAEYAVLLRGAERALLRLGFAGPKSSAPAVAASAVKIEEGEKVLEETQFGKRVGDTRWILSRAAVMSYYQELLDNPDRIAALYMSMKPDYNGDEIAGYRVNQEGERDFFKAMGLKEGDVVRKVNSMNMTSQARAEYFIGEFAKNRLNAMVIDIERNGQPQKMIYLAR